jgi:hypothetical protein
VQFIRLDPDPDLATQINADPDLKPWGQGIGAENLRIQKQKVTNLRTRKTGHSCHNKVEIL